MLAVWLVGVAVLAATLVGAHRESRDELRQRFADRAGVAASFVGTYAHQLTAAQGAVARRRLSGSRVSRAAFRAAVAEAGAGPAVLLDERGRALRLAPSRASLEGKDLGRVYPHLRAALAGRSAVSRIVRSAVEQEPIVAFAVPITTAGGRRVFSSGYTIASTPLGAYLHNALPLEGGRAILLDGHRRVIASNAAAGRRHGQRVPTDLAAVGRGGSGRHHVVVRAVAGTPWQIVMSVPHSTLYEPVNGAARWVPWLVLLALSGAGLIAVLLLVRLQQTQRALRDDIENRVAVERALADSNARHRSIIRSLPDAAVLLYDHDLRYTEVDGPALAAMGWSESALVGRRLSEAVSPELAALLAPSYRAALSGQVTTLAVPSERGDKWFSVEFAPRYGVEGTIEGGMAVARDITARRVAEESLREVEQRFREAFEQAPIGMSMMALDGTWLRVNGALCRMLATTADELVGTTIAAITHADDVGLDDDEIQRCLAGHAYRYSVEKRLVTAAGAAIVVDLCVSVVCDSEAHPLYFLAQITDVTERRQSEERLAFLADHDPLTGLFNRRRFGEELERQVANAARYGAGACLLMLDLDHFKHVNDTLGHSAGDELIVRVSAAMGDRLRSGDVLARLGGDEFAILLPGCTVEEGRGVAADLVAVVRREGLVVDGDTALQVTASVGVAAFAAGGRRTAKELLIDADIALYDAKDAGRATVAVRDPADDRATRMTANVAWAERIRAALETDGFVLYQQPILDLELDRVTRHEILLRMVGSDGEHIAPGVFLPIAEHFGLIARIDTWVVRRSIQLIADQAARGNRLRLEVNLSGASLTDASVMEAIEEELDRTGIDPQLLTFEVTETAAIANIEQARSLAGRLADLGCHFALDDFGAGFASFYYLKHLPFDVLKIDGEFVRGLTSSPRDQLLVRSIADLAAQLGSQTVAEFVGDDDTLELLRSYGVDYVQGYLIGRPVPIDETWPPAPVPALCLGVG